MKTVLVCTLVSLIVLGSTRLVRRVESALSEKLAVGRLSLGQSFADFKAEFNNARCGSLAQAGEILRGYSDHDDFALLGCCLDAPEDLLAFPSSKILPADGCHVLVAFDHEQLVGLRYTVDTPSIDALLPAFLKTYGSPSFDETRIGAEHPTRIVSWVKGHQVLDLVSMNLKQTNSVSVDGTTMPRVVMVHLWRMPS